MEPQFTNQQKPPLVNVIAWMTLASGIVNLFWGIIASLTALATIVGIVCVPLTILPTVLGVFEIIYAAKLLSNPAQPVLASTNIAVLEIVTILVGNLFSMVVGILALVFYNDLVVKDYFARLNGMPAPFTPIVPVEPASTHDLSPALTPEESVEPAGYKPATIMSEPEAAPSDEAPAPRPEETRDEPKKSDE
jgi:hypothetical protein